jgi:hypothetical protein
VGDTGTNSSKACISQNKTQCQFKAKCNIITINIWYMGDCKTRNKTETKRNEAKQAETKRNETRHDRNETK